MAIAQNFAYTELSDYLLNGLVDEGEIPLVDQSRSSPPTPCPPERSTVQDRSSHTAQVNNQKRRRSALDFSFSALDRRPTKKTRLASPHATEASICSFQSPSLASSRSDQLPARLADNHERVIARLPRLAKTCDPVELFASRITLREAPRHVLSRPAVDTPLVFWTDIKHHNLDSTGCLSLTSDILTGAPATLSVVLDVKKAYRGKSFACVEITSNVL